MQDTSQSIKNQSKLKTLRYADYLSYQPTPNLNLV